MTSTTSTTIAIIVETSFKNQIIGCSTVRIGSNQMAAIKWQQSNEQFGPVITSHFF